MSVCRLLRGLTEERRSTLNIRDTISWSVGMDRIKGEKRDIRGERAFLYTLLPLCYNISCPTTVHPSKNDEWNLMQLKLYFFSQTVSFKYCGRGHIHKKSNNYTMCVYAQRDMFYHPKNWGMFKKIMTRKYRITIIK